MRLNLTNVVVYVPEIVSAWTNLGGNVQVLRERQQLLHGHREELDVLRTHQCYRDRVRRRSTRHRTS